VAALGALGLLIAGSLWWQVFQESDKAPEAVAPTGRVPEATPEPAMPMVADLPSLPTLAPDAPTVPPRRPASGKDEASKKVQDVPKIEPTSPPATVQGASDEMHQVVRRLVADFPNHSDALDLMARVEILFGQSARAADCWKKSIELNPNDIRAYRGLANVAQIKNDPQEQLRLLRKALAIDLRSFDVQFDLAKALVDQGQAKEAIKLLQAHLSLYPSSPRSYSLLGAAYLQDNAPKEAKAAYEAAVKMVPSDDFPYLGLAKACARLGEQEAANRHQKKFQELRSGTWQKLRSHRGRYEDLAAQCDTLSNICTQAAGLYHSQGRPREAEQLWRRAAAATPQHADSRKALADLYLQSGRAAEAIPVLEELTRILPADASYCMKLGRLCVESGQTDKAEGAFSQACQRDPKDAAAHAALAELYVKSGRKLAEAVSLARRAAELSPTADRYWLLAAACRCSGDVPGALAALDKAIDLDPGNLQYREAQQTLKEKK
jgi:tetratricopeptide (TPR) repeat protein